MITIPRSEQEAFQSSNPKNLTLNFPYRDPITNDGIYMESSKFEQSICEESNITFGAVYSSRFSVRIFDNGESYVGVRVNPRISVTDDNDRAYERSLGYYTVKSDKLTSDKLYRDLDCYDYLADVLPVDFHAWHNSRPASFTMKQYRDAFFSYIQLEQVPITLPNDGITFTKMEMEKLSGADILSLILQLNGAFGFIGIDGRFKYVIPKTTPDYTIEDNSFVQGSLDYEDEPIKKISGIKLTGYSVEYGEEAQSYTIPDVLVGNEDENVVTIEDNCLTHLVSPFARQVICENLYNSLKDYHYYPTKVKLPAYIGLEPGDVFQIVTDRKTITFPAFERTLSGISMLMDEIEAQGETDIVINANSVGNGLSSVQVVLKQMQLSVTEMLAQKASIEAQDAAIAANIAANGALTQLSIVQDVAGTLNWIREHGTFVQTTDVVINPNTVYFAREDGEYVPVVSPDPNLNPMAEGWYVLDVTASQSEYIMAHLAVTEAGLWVLPFNTLSPHPLVDSDENDLIDSDNNYLVDWSRDPQYSTGYKVLLSNTGMSVYDSFGSVVANYGETTTIGNTLYYNAFIDSLGMKIRYGSKNLASYGSSTIFYKPDGVTKAVEIDSNGIDIKTGHIGGFQINEGVSLSRSITYDGVNYDTVAFDTNGINFNNLDALISYLNTALLIESTEVQINTNNCSSVFNNSGLDVMHEAEEVHVTCSSDAGSIYMYSQGYNSPLSNRGMYGLNGIGNSHAIIDIGQNNICYFRGPADSVSDLKKKDVISDYEWKIDEFIRGLKPIAYKRKYEDGTLGDRIHMGFGAQDVSKLSKTLYDEDLSLYRARIIDESKEGPEREQEYHGEDIEDSKLSWSLVYEELIAPMVLEIQRLMKRVDELEERLKGE